jgi:hypothetical protein
MVFEECENGWDAEGNGAWGEGGAPGTGDVLNTSGKQSLFSCFEFAIRKSRGVSTILQADTPLAHFWLRSFAPESCNAST